jgi:hypothetical protein
MVLLIMLCIVSIGMLFNALKEKEVNAERFVGFEILFILWGVTVLFPSFGEAPCCVDEVIV